MAHCSTQPGSLSLWQLRSCCCCCCGGCVVVLCASVGVPMLLLETVAVAALSSGVRTTLLNAQCAECRVCVWRSGDVDLFSWSPPDSPHLVPHAQTTCHKSARAKTSIICNLNLTIHILHKSIYLILFGRQLITLCISLHYD